MNACKGFVMAGLISAIGAWAMICIPANSAFAQEKKKEWTFAAAPYVWMAGIDGEADIGGDATDIEVAFDDIWEADFPVGTLVQMEARKGTVGFFVQPNFLTLTDQKTLAAQNGEIETEFAMVEFGGMYRLAESKGELPMTFDFLIGGRYWDINNEIQFSTPTGAAADNRRFDEELIDPIVGLRLHAYVSKRFYVRIRGDVGGFDIGSSSSKISRQAQGIVAFDASDRVKLYAGYRLLDIDTDADRLALKMQFYGPIVGVGFHF
ncbi:MAG: hypothetical protein ACQERN_11635 [Thermodesulfobacteriota bacterium]